ncbi:MAG TPA: hypothetical protein VLU06_06160 [Thermoanaerobaculia bacterium]|nr:hypothetical protein [Thermoanaerobaculia bacterium]
MPLRSLRVILTFLLLASRLPAAEDIKVTAGAVEDQPSSDTRLAGSRSNFS